jgi:hypothetical protein
MIMTVSSAAGTTYAGTSAGYTGKRLFSALQQILIAS